MNIQEDIANIRRIADLNGPNSELRVKYGILQRLADEVERLQAERSLAVRNFITVIGIQVVPMLEKLAAEMESGK